jgi:hypothetical protein
MPVESTAMQQAEFSLIHIPGSFLLSLISNLEEGGPCVPPDRVVSLNYIPVQQKTLLHF